MFLWANDGMCPGCGGVGGGGNVSLRCLGILRQSVLGPVFSQQCAWVCSMCVCGGPKEPRLPRILHSCLDVLWHSRPTAVFCFPGPRAYFERHSHGQDNRSTLSLSHTHSSTTHTYISWRRHRIPFQIWEKECECIGRYITYRLWYKE